jgi:hypothetical protein
MLSGALYFSFFVFSIIISIQDTITGSVSRSCLWAAAVVALLLRWVMNATFPTVALIGGMVGIAVFFLAFFCSGQRLGLADVWYAGLMGIVFGPLWWYVAIGSACIYTLIWLLVTRRRSAPFIPFMTAGGLTIIPFIFAIPRGTYSI